MKNEIKEKYKIINEYITIINGPKKNAKIVCRKY